MSFRKLGEAYSLGKLGKAAQQGFNWNQCASFEGGTLTPNPTGWDAVNNAAGSMSITAAAAMRGQLGVQIAIAGVGTDGFGRLQGLVDETVVTVQFLFDPNSIVMANGDTFNFLTSEGAGPLANPIRLQYRQIAGVQSGLALARDDTPATQQLGFAISNETHQIRLTWRAAGVGLNNGFYRVYMDNVMVVSIENIDNDQYDIDQLLIGANAVDAGTNGTIYFDDCCWANRLI